MPKEQKTGWYPFDEQKLKGSRQLKCGKSISIEMPISSCIWCGNGITIFAGGGGKMKSGIQNGMIFAQVEEYEDNSLILQPYGNLFTGTRVVNDLALHPEYPLQVLAALGDGTVGVFELEEVSGSGGPTCIEVGAFVADESPKYPGVNVISFSPDGKTLVTGGVDRKIRFFDYDFVDPRRVTGNFSPYLILEPLQVVVECLSFSSSGKFLLVSGYGKKKAVVINLEKKDATPKQLLLETGDYIVRGSIAVGNVFAVFGIRKGKTYLMRYAANSCKLLSKQRILSSTIVAWCLSPKQDALIIGDNELNIQLHRADDRLSQVGGMRITDKDTEFLQCLAVTPSLSHVMSGFLEKKLNLHKLYHFRYKIFTCYNFLVLILTLMVVVCWGVSLGLIPPSILTSSIRTGVTHDEL